MSETRSAAAERLLRIALRLFAEKGYDRTGVADIQGAAGLNPGSGALYKHFESKEAILRAGVDEFIASAEQGRSALADVKATPSGLKDIGQRILDALTAESDMMRIIWRDIQSFPGERRRVVDGRMQETFDMLADWIVRAGGRKEDAKELAVMAVGSLIFFRLFNEVFGETPADLSENDYLDVWAGTLTRTLRSRK